VLVAGAAVGGICMLVFLHDVLRNPKLSAGARARWAGGFTMFPPTVTAYWWIHARDRR
jgi:hypothetical protein